MSRIKQLRLVLPNVLSQLRAMLQRGEVADIPPLLLALLLQGERQRLWQEHDLGYARLDPWQHSVLCTLPESLRPHGIAAGALCWRGEGGNWRPGTWMQLELLHLAAGMDNLSVVLPASLDATDVKQLMASLQPIFSLLGFELQCSPAGHWYIWCERQLELLTYSVHSGFATRMYDILPSGPDGPELRRLMTEIQMLLHQQPLNTQREQQGLPTLNALWFSGAGTLELVTATTTQRIFSNDAYVQGLCDHLQVSCWPLPANALGLLSGYDEDVVAVTANSSLPNLEQEWLAPIIRALAMGSIGQVDLHLDQWRIMLYGGRWQQLRRMFTRTTADLQELVA